MSDTTPTDGNRNDGKRNDENWTDNPENTGEVREPVEQPEHVEQPEPVEHAGTDEHHAAAGTDPNGFTGTGSHAAVSEPTPAETPAEAPAQAPEPTPADAMTHESYRPAATVAAAAPAAAAPAATPDYAPREQATDYVPTQTATPQPIYVQAPTPPRYRGNRATGILVALLATVAYAVLYALVAIIIVGVNVDSAAEATARFTEFVVRPVFYIPVIFFFIALAVLVALVNRGGWWAYVLFGFAVAAVVYFSYIGGALLTVQAWNYAPEEAVRFVNTLWLNPLAIAAAVIAREVPIWAGAWIARSGRSVTARNAEARAEYERQLAEGPQVTRSA
ncbi:hypothetical protein [Cryobacterium tagatosivorans]|uniref:Uncharacterized protein n=1 Tax=Cryobacterium tagatosivorans TaxID=1259199 RepID=A0A4R8UBP2_9MICO|nr:hypothetical protein [Cryobacterium tagatosivorans]TFB48437.1 hypothetical protein E3O23_13290 [Cryobacterium tagatosivorans]